MKCKMFSPTLQSNIMHPETLRIQCLKARMECEVKWMPCRKQQYLRERLTNTFRFHGGAEQTHVRGLCETPLEEFDHVSELSQKRDSLCVYGQ